VHDVCYFRALDFDSDRDVLEDSDVKKFSYDKHMDGIVSSWERSECFYIVCFQCVFKCQNSISQ
jgi:hypothetical protein